MQHDKSKHMEVDGHFIKDNLEAKIISLPQVHSEYQLADILTKAVKVETSEEVISMLGICNPMSNLRGSVGKSWQISLH